jgi:hypothetical protein
MVLKNLDRAMGIGLVPAADSIANRSSPLKTLPMHGGGLFYGCCNKTVLPALRVLTEDFRKAFKNASSNRI